MSFKKRNQNSTKTRKRKLQEVDTPNEDEDQLLDLVQQTKLLQQGRARLKGSDLTPNREVKQLKSKNDESDFSQLKFGLNSFHPQVDLPVTLQEKMDAYIEDKLANLVKGSRSFKKKQKETEAEQPTSHTNPQLSPQQETTNTNTDNTNTDNTNTENTNTNTDNTNTDNTKTTNTTNTTNTDNTKPTNTDSKTGLC
eukprot:TRINITY_DN4555_c0_g1_i4.p1 TRINITY_DN4555_c0_g1~~TRINITY_DN4555_c0_g1_i4.p1  ORF type:complete len:196 (-),score=64.00 TRINITY_DN4555_c0_g1_i4:62-649(-)